MIEFLRVQYALGRVSKEQLRSLVGTVLTEEDYLEITSAKENKV